MSYQSEFDLRAALCRKLAKREPENRAYWMAEAETWSRLSKEGSRGAAEERMSSGIWRLCGRNRLGFPFILA